MAIAMQCTKIAIALVTTFAVSQASAQSANSTNEEIAALKRQLRLLEEKLDRLEKQTVANTSAAKAKAEPKVSVANANATIPVRVPAPPPGAIVTMPNNRPTICTAPIPIFRPPQPMAASSRQIRSRCGAAVGVRGKLPAASAP